MYVFLGANVKKKVSDFAHSFFLHHKIYEALVFHFFIKCRFGYAECFGALGDIAVMVL